jgi:16S rRNA processing protein RimM
MKSCPEMLVIAKFGAAFGIKGHIKLNYYSDNLSLLKGDLFYNDNNSYKIIKLKIISSSETKIIVQVDNVNDRDAAQQWCNKLIYIDRGKLPEIQNNDEYYVSDLIGLEVICEQKTFGKVLNVHNFGAGDIVEIATNDGKNMMIIFSNENFPQINLKEKQIICNLPEIMIAENELKKGL